VGNLGEVETIYMVLYSQCLKLLRGVFNLTINVELHTGLTTRGSAGQ